MISYVVLEFQCRMETHFKTFTSHVLQLLQYIFQIDYCHTRCDTMGCKTVTLTNFVSLNQLCIFENKIQGFPASASIFYGIKYNLFIIKLKRW